MIQLSAAIAPRTYWAGWLAAATMAAMAAGCSTYEDTYSGTYREVVDSSGRTGDAVAVDLFRFGDNAAAIVRFYKRDPITGDPFYEQEFCTWTSAEMFDEDDHKFRLYLNKSSDQLPRSQLFGQVDDQGSLSVSLYDERTGNPYDGIDELSMHRYRSSPRSECDMIDNFAVDVAFPRDSNTGQTQRMPASTGYDITNPVLAVSWPSVQPTRGSTLFAPINRHRPAVLLDDGLGRNYDPAEHALQNDRTLLVPPPPDIVRMPSGTTTLALGHFVVVDDSKDDRPNTDANGQWQFRWDINDEKLVASALRQASSPVCSDGGHNGTNRFGRALLFVEGRLDDLSRGMKDHIDGIDQCIDTQKCDRHFFLVDVCAADSYVLGLVLANPSPAGRQSIPEVPMFVTDAYLTATSIPLPRENPYNL